VFEVYIALGDSMSIDFYPAQDAERVGLDVREDIGSASLLFRNESSLFPDFDERDLQTRFSGIQYKNLAVDGATCEDSLLQDYFPQDEMNQLANQGRALVTLTLGGNDLLHARRRSQGDDLKSLQKEFFAVQERYEKVVLLIREKFSDCVLMLTTVYDPTDGSGILPTTSPLYGGDLPIEFLEQFNSFVRDLARSHGLLLADVHKHFLGHGATCGTAENFWFWPASPIEPSYRGASEIRRVWLATLDSHV